ncbi:MAG: DUF3256 family protein [Prevotella sp.]|nr:DUF3256 family protein [Prevotella sp.]
MRKLFYSLILVLIASSSVAQELVIRDVFKQMPDSLMPYLSTNNRLDFIDFLDSNMKAEVKNLFDGTSEMTALTSDSLSIRMNGALHLDMLLLKLDKPLDTISYVLVFAETFKTDSVYGDTNVKFFTTTWQQIRRNIPWNDIQRTRIENLGLQNILKWDKKKFNES